MSDDDAFQAALAAFNPGGWPVQTVTGTDAAPAPRGPAIIVIRGANDPAHDRTKRRFTEVGVIGGTDPAWIGATKPPPTPPGESGALIVSFFTRATRYEAYAARLRASLDRQGVAHELVGLDVPGSWEMVCAFKAEFIQDQWRRTDRPVIWLDADATLEAPPALLAAPGADFAINKHGGWKFSAGSILFGRSQAAEALLDRWVLRCRADPKMWDQNHLDAAWADVSATMPLVTRWLPPSYSAIWDHYDAAAFGPPVVSQHQASRAEARSGRKQEAPPPQPEALRRARRASRWLRGTGSQFGDAAPLKPAGSVPPALAARLRAIAQDSLPLVDIGCGGSGIAAAFLPGAYVGTDIRPEAMVAARTAMPDHAWRLLMEEYPYPTGGCVLLLDVLAHVPDAALAAILDRAAAAAPRLIIVERFGGAQREATALVSAAGAAGWLPDAREAADGGREILVFRRG
ncbi:hypothetical protein AAFN86_21305 [Roseomonas sp. CAU 1739]|uniref:hypothetical protein n=1 Tax=Roseomonas sp. CAU 1739 TaxID=3140364 RepID=UPI00325C216D